MKSRTMSSQDFLAQLGKRGGSFNTSHNGHIVVEHDVSIDGDRIKLGNVSIESVTFTGLVTLQHCTGGYSYRFEESNFLGGLCIEAMDCLHVGISSCKAKWLNMWRCKLDSAYIGNTEVNGTTDISGLNLANYLRLKDNEFGDVDLVHGSTRNRIAAQAVETDDPILAFQFRTAGIPVFMSTAGARELMRLLSRADALLAR